MGKAEEQTVMDSDPVLLFFKVTVTVFETALHPAAVETRTKYEPAAFAMIDLDVALLLHKYESPVEAVRVTLLP